MYILILAPVISCSKKEKYIDISSNSCYKLIKEHDSLYYLQLVSDNYTDSWALPYPVFRYTTGDIDHNGMVDMLVGVIKQTRFDSTYAKRLFIFKNYKGRIRPLWLGSRLGQPLEDFQVVSLAKGSFVWSIEKEKSGRYLVAEYAWEGFGLAFNQYIVREKNLSQARKTIKNAHKTKPS
ncbi:MAG: hypothetical protein JXB24_00025 [Bacteroidales bacterium]|nr:hypothetical protein [Bacteroidales bacterium]